MSCCNEHFPWTFLSPCLEFLQDRLLETDLLGHQSHLGSGAGNEGASSFVGSRAHSESPAGIAAMGTEGAEKVGPQWDREACNRPKVPILVIVG